MMKRVVLIVLTSVLIHSLTISLCNAERIMRLSDRKMIDFSRLIAEIRGSRLIFVGEDHELMDDHQRQLRVIRALHESGAPLAIGLEMFNADNQEYLDRWVAGKIDEADFIPFYKRNWEVPWSFYRDIFLFARRYSIPLLGLNLPREIVHKVAREGFAALTPEEKKKLPADVTCNVDSAYMAMVRRAFAAHSGNEKLFIHFCEAQMLWNKGMARHLLEYIKRRPGGAVVVLAGTGHAMKTGIPLEVREDAGVEGKVILPIDDLRISDLVTEADTDYLIER
jgi:uncharacterized iron-regulated protein